MPSFTPDSNKDRIQKLSQGNPTILMEMIIGALIKGLNGHILEMSAFLFGEWVTTSIEAFHIEEHKWL